MLLCVDVELVSVVWSVDVDPVPVVWSVVVMLCVDGDPVSVVFPVILLCAVSVDKLGDKDGVPGEELLLGDDEDIMLVTCDVEDGEFAPESEETE